MLFGKIFYMIHRTISVRFLRDTIRIFRPVNPPTRVPLFPNGQPLPSLIRTCSFAQSSGRLRRSSMLGPTPPFLLHLHIHFNLFCHKCMSFSSLYLRLTFQFTYFIIYLPHKICHFPLKTHFFTFQNSIYTYIFSFSKKNVCQSP